MVKSRWTSWLALGAMAVQTVYTPLAQADGWLIAAKQTTVQQLARQIDKLERHLDEYGTVVAKAPDVWGQARLTKYRREYEELLVAERTEFKDTINASISRSDQAFLASALALQAAISGNQATMTVPVTRELTTSKQSVARNLDGTVIYDKSGNPVLLTNTNPELVTNNEQQPLGVPNPSTSAAGLISTPEFTSHETLSVRDTSGFAVKDGVALEPTVHLDQLSRYMNHLHELRRISDGDDKADAPGYALHLVRLPVSVLPGKRTREGYGAEVTFIAKPHLHERLLPTTFRGLVVNDVVEHLAFPLANFIDRNDAKEIIEIAPRALTLRNNQDQVKKIKREIELMQSTLCRLKAESDQQKIAGLAYEYAALTISVAITAHELGLLTESQRDCILAGAEKSKRESAKKKNKSVSPEGNLQLYNGDELGELHKELVQLSNNFNVNVSRVISNTSLLEGLGNRLKEAQVNLPSMAGARNRRAILPYPTTQAFEVMGIEQLITLAKLALPLKDTRFNNNSTLILDLETFLSEEVNSAYDYLNHNEHLWQSCTVELAQAIRAKNAQQLAVLRQTFMEQICLSDEVTHTGVLAWAIIVESALLNERLVEDMRELAASKNAFCLNTSWLPYFGPNPPAEAVESFNQYVTCRWPIHVVAIDPVTQDQNVADRFSQRREMQLALSLAFASGRMGAQKFMRFNRRLELDMETIALHRTTVGFSHGDDTFGWRFMPRVQSPDTESPAKTVGRMLFTGGPTRNYLEKESRLEPGIRECTAIVIMPSFVPYVVFDMRTNWFKLNNPSKKELDLRDGVGLSSDITSLRCLSQQCVEDQHLYRQDEVYRLNRAVDQLEKRLPLQTTYVQMPFENSLGGFEFFNSGVSDLAPQLKGFYGEPGVKIGSGESTTLFLVGDHFSNHETKVIAGNMKIENNALMILSRQVLQITIPGNVHVSDDVVDIHVATPYGVSNHVVVPVVGATADSVADAISKHVELKHVDKFSWSADTVNVQLTVDCRRFVKRVCLQSDLSIKSAETSPFSKDKGTAEFRGLIFEKTSGKDAEKKSFATAKICKVEFEEGTASVRGDGSGLEDAIFAALACSPGKYTVPQDIEAFEIQGFLKFKNDAQPVIKLENRLKVKVTVKVCDEKGTAEKPACANDQSDPFEMDDTTLEATIPLPASQRRRPQAPLSLPRIGDRSLETAR